MTDKLDRRHFLRGALAAGAGLTAAGAASAKEDDAKKGGKKDDKKDDKKAADPSKPAKTVPRRQLGGTGETIPILLFGCAQRFDPRYDKMLHRGFKDGINYLDTALVYARGMSHKTLAPFIKQVGRKKLWITSKAPHRGNRADVSSYTTDLDKCLKQLKVDQLDLFFMHALNNAKYVTKEYVKMGERMKKQNKIRFFGFSCHDGNVVELLNKAAAVGGIDAIMFRYNFAQYGDKKLNKAIDACKKAKIGLIAMKTQRSVKNQNEKVTKFESKNFTLAQAKLKAVWADERIDSAVSHMDNMRKLKENVAAAKSPIKISMNEFQQLQRIATCTNVCNGCTQHCEAAVDGETKVADALRFLMYHDAYGEREKAKELYRELSPAERRFETIDFTAATQACPEGIDIRAQLERARDILA